MIKKNKNGFTLVELLAVIVVLAIIMLVVANRVGDAMLKSRANSLALQVQSLQKEVEKIGATDNQITTNNIKNIVTKGDLKYLGYIKAGTEVKENGAVIKTFEDDAVIIQAVGKSKFANIKFTDDIEKLGNYVVSYETTESGNNLVLGNKKAVEKNKEWLRKPILYFETTVPIIPSSADDTGADNVTGDETNPSNPDSGDNDKTPDTPNPEPTPKPSTKPAPKPTPSGTYKTGARFCLNRDIGECFRVLYVNGSTVTALAEKNISYNIQTDGFAGVPFCEQSYAYGYWQDSNTPIDINGTRYYFPLSKYDTYKTNLNNNGTYTKPPTVYPPLNEDVNKLHSNFRNSMTNYKDYLINKLGKKSLKDIRLITYNELIKLGCEVNNGEGSCNNSKYKNWIIPKTKAYWTASASYSNKVYIVKNTGELVGAPYLYINERPERQAAGIVPVITIDKSEINILPEQ